MELKASSLKPGGLSASDCASDLEEKEVSDDDDRNHKHRRRETRSQSSERDSLELIFTRSYRERNKPFENGHSSWENESQGSETWKNYNIAHLDKDFTSKFDKRRPGMASISRINMDLNQRIRSNRAFYGEPGPGRGRGRDPGPWNLHDSRFSSIDISSQMVQQGSIAPSLFAGLGQPNVSSAQNPSWNTFGLITGIPNGGFEALHSIGLQGTLRPSLISSMDMGIPHQQCRDFEGRGFCLRGDICPMEHSVNRIVVEDVQSLSQFNLPVSLSSGPLVGTAAGAGALPSVGAPSTTLLNSKGLHVRSSKPGGMVDDGMGFNGAYSGSATVSGADLYDPDQPLWNNNGSETSTALLALHLHSSKNDETGPFMSVDTSDHHHISSCDSAENVSTIRSSGIPVTSQSANSSVRSRFGAKNRSNIKDKTDLPASTSEYLDNKTNEDQDAFTNLHGKQMIGADSSAGLVDSSGKTQSDAIHNMRKSCKKALRTLFVCGVPQKSNRRDALLSHFQKFGEVIDIYIPSNTEQAFVQFSKREEAEAALRAPDAVMGNRFIKLWWANRDSIPDDGINNNNNVSVTPRGLPPAFVPAQLSTSNKGKDNISASMSKGTMVPSEASQSSSDLPRPGITNGPKAPSPLQKKLELEQLKEELRKKQELLAQKRNDFRRQLDKLEKQGTGVKGEVLLEPVAKRQRVVASDAAKATTPKSSDHLAEIRTPKNNLSGENIIPSSPKTKTVLVQQESASLKQPIRQMAAAGVPFVMNRYKLDNRPTAFSITSPLPPGLANLDALKEHFSSYGDLSTVVLEDFEAADESDGQEVPKNCAACVTFTTRRSAERAFSNGKCWQGNNLQFMWVTCSTSSASDLSSRENIPSASKCHVDTNIEPVDTDIEPAVHMVSHEEHDISERNCDMEVHEISESYPTCIPGEDESPKHEGSETFMAGTEDLP